jgi:hypothetical protein
VADPPFKIHSKPPLLAPATGLHLDLIHGGVEALYIPPLLGREEARGLRLGRLNRLGDLKLVLDRTLDWLERLRGLRLEWLKGLLTPDSRQKWWDRSRSPWTLDAGRLE